MKSSMIALGFTSSPIQPIQRLMRNSMSWQNNFPFRTIFGFGLAFLRSYNFFTARPMKKITPIITSAATIIQKVNIRPPCSMHQISWRQKHATPCFLFLSKSLSLFPVKEPSKITKPRYLSKVLHPFFLKRGILYVPQMQNQRATAKVHSRHQVLWLQEYYEPCDHCCCYSNDYHPNPNWSTGFFLFFHLHHLLCSDINDNRKRGETRFFVWVWRTRTYMLRYSAKPP